MKILTAYRLDNCKYDADRDTLLLMEPGTVQS